MKRAVGLLLFVLPLTVLKLTGQSVNVTDITGTPNIGLEITGNYTGDFGATGDHYKYEWKYSPSESVIAGAVDTFYIIQASDNGKDIYFKVSVMDASNAVLAKDSSSVITVNSYPVAANPMVIGEVRSGLTIYGAYTFFDADSDPDNNSVYHWYRSNNSGGTGSITIGTNSRTYKVQDGDEGKYIGFSVTPGSGTGSSPGASSGVSSFVHVEDNYVPVATIQPVTGSLNVNGVLTGHYIYSDYEGDLESGSTYLWSRTLDTTAAFLNISGETAISYRIKEGEERYYFRFSVTPKAATGNSPGIKVTSDTIGPSKSKPYATNVWITGKDSVGQILQGSFTFNDYDGDLPGTSLFQWFRNGTAIPLATSQNYTLKTADVDTWITFQVTPVSSGTASLPNTGLPVTSSNSKGPVEDPTATPPTATDLCISGTRAKDQVLTGRYTYNNDYNEQNSYFIWYSNNVKVKEGTGNSNLKYTVLESDLGKEIVFAVIPRNNRPMIGDTAFSAPLAIFNLDKVRFSETDSAYVLKALPKGGVFSGSGVTDSLFYPNRLNPDDSPFTLTYQLTIENSNICIQRATKDVEVIANLVEFQGINSVYCDFSGPDTIYVTNVPPGVAFGFYVLNAPSGYTILSDSSVVIYPDAMSTGNGFQILEYAYYDGMNYVYIEQGLNIEHIGEVKINNLFDGQTVCKNDAPFDIYTTKEGGAFTGPVNAGKLDPALAGPYGPAKVLYSFITSQGCIQKDSVVINFRPIPVISFVPEDYCILSSTDSTRLINSSASVDPVISWQWEFSEGGNTTASSRKDPAYLYTTGGDHKIYLTATTVYNCTTTDDQTFDLGVKPTADFYWKNECFHADSSIYFFDNSYSASKIASRTWKFLPTDSLRTVKNPVYAYPDTGYLPVQYTINTAYAGCNDVITKEVYIRPTVVLLPGDQYFEQFEEGRGGWEPDYELLNTWTFGTPDRDVIKTAASGNNSWYTGFDKLNQEIESSSVISPCFDFTDIERPMIRLQLWKRFDTNRDGAALQYKIGDAPAWEYVGTLDDGINWYNSTLIKGRPGGDQVGWTSKGTPETKWAEASHKLEELKGKRNVKFRIAYGSDGSSVDNDGIAFDDIWIGERTRYVLLEHFANTSSPASSDATEMVNDVALHNTADVINIQYHTNFPGQDSYYDDNPGDAGARILYYGLIKAPYTFIDGGNKIQYANIFDYNLAELDTNDVIRRSLINPAFRIELNSAVTGGVLTISGKLTALRDISSENVTLFIAVTEKENSDYTGANGETTFYNVFRKFIPDAGGINLQKTWATTDVYNFSDLTWIISNIENNADIEVIAFVQNNVTKELYQASSKLEQDIIVGIENPVGKTGTGFNLYPNPAGARLTVSFTENIPEEAEIRIYNLQGIVIASYRTGTGVSNYIIEDLNLRNGIYLVRITSGGLDIGFRKLVISGRD
jgi:hypothetical protein